MLEPGSIIGGKYRLVAQIGAGGMGVVWKATHEHLGHDIAVKFLTNLATSVEGLVARFLDEARTAASVRHRNVVHILDFGVTDDQRPYMVMEYLEGESLADRLERAPPLTLMEVTQTIALTLSGLAAVHDRGIIHRDLKPDNVFLTYDADGFFPKILDFGVSKDIGREEDGNRAARTRDGVLLGTPQYMSPEQARGLRDIDIRTDIYSMGVILYETLTGTRPFDSENVGDMLMDVIKGNRTPLDVLRPDLPRALTNVIERAMSVEREARFPDAREMRNAVYAATAVTRPDAFGITDPSGAINAELASAVARALKASTPEGSVAGELPRTPLPISGVGVVVPLHTPSPAKLPASSVDSTIPFRTDSEPGTTSAASSSTGGQSSAGAGGAQGAAKDGAKRTRSGATTVPGADSPALVKGSETAPAPRGRAGRWLMLATIAAAGGGLGALEYQSPGSTRAMCMSALIGLRNALPTGVDPNSADESSDAGVAPLDAGSDAGVIHVRLRQIPAESVVMIDGRTYTAAEVDAMRAPDGGMVVIDVPQRRELYDIRVEAPGFEPFEGRRYATASVMYRLRMRPIEDAGADAGADADAGPGDAVEPEPTSPPRYRRRRR